jgi:uncharacterized protein (TIGR00369 family)
MSTEVINARERSFHVKWDDPMIGAKAARTMDGLTYLRRILGGSIPRAPIANLINFQVVEIEKGRVVFEITPAEYHYNPIGMVHGGIACTLLDSAIGCAVHSLLPAGAAYTSLELKVNFIRPITAHTGRLRCEGKVIHAGSRIATGEGKMTDSKGILYAHAVSTCLVMEQTQNVDLQQTAISSSLRT